MRDAQVSVNAKSCIRCAACSSLTPGVFRLDPGVPSRVLRPPASTAEHTRCAVAARICPTAAIRVVDAPAARLEEARSDDLLTDALFYGLFEEAEKVRWRMSDIPWHELRREAASPALLSVVRANAASEMTTYTASRRFLQEFSDDPDFSQWVTVWAYEETKHPQVLMRWLAACGQTFDAAFVMRGRWASPFMRSRVGMLATNVVSELVASAGYLALARRTEEPLLGKIAMLLASDEARHASSFFRYVERAIVRAERPDTERAAALRVLHVWLNEPEKMGHPVHQFHALKESGFAHPLESTTLRTRIREVFSLLVGRTLDADGELLDVARSLEGRA
jgi:ferredoxin